MRSPEFKQMMGDRMQDSDGFTYIYGAVKDGSTVRPSSGQTKRSIRNDKCSVRAKEANFDKKAENN